MKRLEKHGPTLGYARYARYATVGAGLALGCMAMGVLIGQGMRTGSFSAAPPSAAPLHQDVDMVRHMAPSQGTHTLVPPTHAAVPMQRPQGMSVTPPGIEDPLPPLAGMPDLDDPLPPLSQGPHGSDKPRFLDDPLPPDPSLDDVYAWLRLDEPLPPR